MKEKKPEYQFAEIVVDNSILEQFSQDMSAYHEDELSMAKHDFYASFKRKLIWHIKHSLSGRQRQTLMLVLSGKTERETAAILGVSQQVVHIYKWRAVNKLKDIFQG